MSDPAARPGYDGIAVGADAALGLKESKILSGKFPAPAAHTSLEVLRARERESYAWGTGLVWLAPTRPFSTYFLGGTTLHVDGIRGDPSFGMVSPYAEVGARLALHPREEGGSGAFVSVSLGGFSSLNFLKPDTLYDGYFLARVGLGWETE